MRSLNARGQVRECIPEGRMVGRSLVLVGARILDAEANYLGFWYAENMPSGTRRELRKELAANWEPGFVNAQDW